MAQNPVRHFICELYGNHQDVYDFIVTNANIIGGLTFQFSEIGFLQEFIDQIVVIMPKCVNLRQIEIDGSTCSDHDNDYTGEFYEKIVKLVKACDGRLTVFDLGSGRISRIINKDISAFMDALQTCTRLRTFGVQFSASQLKYLAPKFQYFPELKNLDLGEIIYEDIGWFIDALKACTLLQNWKVSLTEMGIAQLSTNLKHFLHLESLRFSKMTDVGAIALAINLPTCSKLKILVFALNCNIGDAGAIAIANILPFLTNLTFLDLSGNKIGPSGAIAIANVLHHCVNLETLKLDGNEIQDSGAIAIAGSLFRMARPLNISVERNNMTRVGVDALFDAANTNLNIRQSQFWAHHMLDGHGHNPAYPAPKLDFALLSMDQTKKEWKFKIHDRFGAEVNSLFAHFLMGFIKVIETGSVRTDFNLVDETLESYEDPTWNRDSDTPSLPVQRTSLTWPNEVIRLQCRLMAATDVIPGGRALGGVVPAEIQARAIELLDEVQTLRPLQIKHEISANLFRENTDPKQRELLNSAMLDIESRVRSIRIKIKETADAYERKLFAKFFAARDKRMSEVDMEQLEKRARDDPFQ